MKKLISLLLAGAMLAGISVTALAVEPAEAAFEAAKTYFEKADGKNMLSLEQVLEIAEAGDSLILDIRSAEDYAKGHLKGAVNIPFVKVVEFLDQLPREQRIVVACYSGQTAGQIVGSLRLAGFHAYSLSGGMGSVTEDTPLETEAHEFAPAEKAQLNETEAALLEAARTAMTILEGNNVIKPADLNEHLADYFVLDVRDAETFAKGHIEGAVNVPYLEMGGYIDQLPRDKTIAVVCNSGQQSSQTVAVLIASGFKALNVQSGMNNGWNKANLPTVSDQPAQPEPAPEKPAEPAPVQPAPQPEPQPEPQPAPAQPQAKTYIVKSGDCLWNIARDQLGSGVRWNEIYQLNRDIIRNPERISIGQELKLPA